MPIYEYGCNSCGHDFDKLMKMSADAPPCPVCESADVRKKVSASAFQLKGPGWYKDHYGLKTAAPSSGTPSPAAKPSKPDATAASSTVAPTASVSKTSGD